MIEDIERQAHEELDRSRLASQIIDNPLWGAAFEKLDAELVAVFREGSASDDAGLVRAALAVKLLSQLKRILEGHITTGKLAERALDDLTARRERVQRRSRRG